MSARRVLYIDLAPTPGGSVFSLAYLLRYLDRARVHPMVLLAEGNPAVVQFQDMDVPVYTMPTLQGRGVSFGRRVDAVRQGRVGAWVRRHPRLAALWHAGGTLGRWQRRFWPEAQRIRAILRRARPDLVHLNAELVINRAGALAAWLNRTPTVCHVRGWETWDVWDRLLSRTVRAFICISEAVAAPLRAYGVRDERIHVVYNGVEMADIPTQADPALYAALGLDPQRPVVGMFGRLTWWKGHTVFLEALARVVRVRPEVQAIVVGGEEVTEQGYRRQLEEMAHRLGLADHVRFLGYRSDALRLYALVDVLVHASVRDEPFGRVIVEGMAASRPVVATRGGGPSEIVRDGETGFLVPQRDPDALAQALLRLLNDPGLARRMGAAARADVARRFQARDTAQRVMAIYDTVLGGASDAR